MTTDRAPWRAQTPAALALAAGLVAILALAHAPAIAALAGMWDRNPMYSYGWLVLPISLYMAWARRDRLARLPVRPAPWAAAVVLPAWLALMIVGRFGGVMLAEQLALVVAIVGTLLALTGWPIVRALAAPLAYLLLMIPFWDVLTEPLQLPFQNLTASLALPLLQTVGVPAFRDGTFITLPTARLEVARACSGVNYLVAVLALGLPMALLYLRTPWRRAALVGSGLVTAALSNAVRVTLIGVLVTQDPDTPLHGPGHLLHGLFVAAIGYVTLFAVLALLSRGEAREATPALARPSVPAEPAVPTGPIWAQRALPAALLVAALVGGTTLFLGGRTASPVALAGTLDGLPRQLDEWTADPLTRPSEPRWWPAADHTLLRTYRRDRLAADVFVGYFARQRHPREVITPVVEPLHREAEIATLAAGGGAGIPVNRVTSTDGPGQRLTLFWYDVDGRSVASPTAVRLHTAWNAVLHDRSNGAVISVSLPITAQANAPEDAAALEGLALAIERALDRCLPGRVIARSILSPRPTGAA